MKCNGQKGCERRHREEAVCRSADSPTPSLFAPLTPPPSAGVTAPALPKDPGTEIFPADLETSLITAAPSDNEEQLIYQFEGGYLDRLWDTHSLPLPIDTGLLPQLNYPLSAASSEMEGLIPELSSISEHSEDCTCQIRLLKLPSIMQSTARASQPDDAYRTTSDVISKLQDILTCKKCQRSLADLICIVSILQETGKSWERLLEAEAFSTVKVTVGGHEVAVSDHTHLQRILVTDLASQAEALLDSIQITAGEVVSQQSEAHFLDQVNVAYLNTVDGHLRDLLRQVKSAMEVPSG